MPTAVFDILSTFFSTEPLRQRLTAIGAPDHTLEQWWAQAQRDHLALSVAGAYLPFEEVLASTLPRAIIQVGAGSADPSRHELVLKGLRVLNPSMGAIDAVNRLSQSSWRLLALTDGSEALGCALLDRAGVRSKFDAVISADHVKRAAPHPDLYARVKKHAEGEAWLLTTRAADATAARRMGLRAAWISKVERQWPAAFKSPDLEAPDLAVCASLLEARGALSQASVAN